MEKSSCVFSLISLGFTYLLLRLLAYIPVCFEKSICPPGLNSFILYSSNRNQYLNAQQVIMISKRFYSTKISKISCNTCIVVVVISNNCIKISATLASTSFFCASDFILQYQVGRYMYAYHLSKTSRIGTCDEGARFPRFLIITMDFNPMASKNMYCQTDQKHAPLDLLHRYQVGMYDFVHSYFFYKHSVLIRIKMCSFELDQYVCGSLPSRVIANKNKLNKSKLD